MSEWKKTEEETTKPENEIVEKLNIAQAHLTIKLEELRKQQEMWLKFLESKSKESNK